MAYFGENWDYGEYPLAYLITIRTYGTWLHGDGRLSVDTQGIYNIRGAPKRPADPNLLKRMTENMTSTPIVLDEVQRNTVRKAIEEVCEHRGYDLRALNVLTNHAHAVVSAEIKPEIIADSFKAYATRKLRENQMIGSDTKPWSRGRSRRYLWKSHHVEAAINYVLYFQGDVVFEDWYSEMFDD